MDTQQTVVPSGQHYSGRNRVPNIQQFVEQLDRDKKERDAAIDAEAKSARRKRGSSEAKDHTVDPIIKKDYRKVRDPVTGKDVHIRDTDLDFTEAVENPQVTKQRTICICSCG